MSTQSNKSYIKYSWFLMGMVFLVILAGGVVRMTQSGMGCPDWPRCFGMWIPPTDASQLPADFEKYLSKQDIDHSFNVYHTWIEYINRLLGALLGVFIFIYALWTAVRFSDRKPRMKQLLLACLGVALSLVIFGSLGAMSLLKVFALMFVGVALYSMYFAVRHSDRRSMVIVAILLLIAVAIQGYLGKIVVDENLNVVKITIHMVGALVIAALPLINISKLSTAKIGVPGIVRHGTTALIIIVLMQIVLGTQVREEIDAISKSLSYQNRELWIEGLSEIFLVHRSFSWLVVLGSVGIWYKSKNSSRFRMMAKMLLAVLAVIILLGIVMSYLDMPAVAQPLHLLLACALLMQLFYMRLQLRNEDKI